ncbi:MAG: hypothetical protein HKL98_04375 [Burkholderiales bacterium]|nr:hypothetical protein [Burkholderiales bacterium]
MDRYWREIVLTLIIKVFVLSLIWYAWFSNPQDEHLDDAAVAARMLNSHIVKDSSHGSIR